MEQEKIITRQQVLQHEDRKMNVHKNDPYNTVLGFYYIKNHLFSYLFAMKYFYLSWFNHLVTFKKYIKFILTLPSTDPTFSTKLLQTFMPHTLLDK